MEPLQLPEDLEARTIARFDDLASKEKIFYEEAVPEMINVNGFDVSSLHTKNLSIIALNRSTHIPQFQFIIASILNKKPIMSANAPSRSKAGGPFINPDPEEVVIDLGPTHRLLVNKYGIFRPMTVIPTTKYALQSDDLDLTDIRAAWGVLRAFKTPSLIIFNCGVNAGSSQGHKHTQVFPLPGHVLWPSRARSRTGE